MYIPYPSARMALVRVEEELEAAIVEEAKERAASAPAEVETFMLGKKRKRMSNSG